MQTLEVLKNPNPFLREKSTPLKEDEISAPTTQDLIDSMIKTMHETNGIGIAAPQVGVHQRMIIVETGHGPIAFINPKITSKSLRKIESEEGCLSVPDVYGIVKRHKKIKVEALSREGKLLKLEVTGLQAVIFQHEIDHLDGILFIDKVKKYTSPPRM
ncbi:peptide deformylase [Patescibacteria group bacterium]